MKRTIAVGLALAMALLGAIPAGAAPAVGSDASLGAGELSQMNHDRGDQGWGDRDRGDQGWGDRDRGDRNDRWGDRGPQGRLDLEGRWIAKVGNAGQQFGFLRGVGGARAGFLPSYLRIDQRRNVIRVADSRDRVLQQILVGAGFRSPANRGDYIIGQWNDSKLQTVRMGPRNTRIIQTFALANRGRTLVIHTRQDGRGTRRDVEFTSVYQRA